MRPQISPEAVGADDGALGVQIGSHEKHRTSHRPLPRKGPVRRLIAALRNLAAIQDLLKPPGARRGELALLIDDLGDGVRKLPAVHAVQDDISDRDLSLHGLVARLAVDDGGKELAVAVRDLGGGSSGSGLLRRSCCLLRRTLCGIGRSRRSLCSGCDPLGRSTGLLLQELSRGCRVLDFLLAVCPAEGKVDDRLVCDDARDLRTVADGHRGVVGLLSCLLDVLSISGAVRHLCHQGVEIHITRRCSGIGRVNRAKRGSHKKRSGGKCRGCLTGEFLHNGGFLQIFALCRESDEILPIRLQLFLFYSICYKFVAGMWSILALPFPPVKHSVQFPVRFGGSFRSPLLPCSPAEHSPLRSILPCGALCRKAAARNPRGIRIGSASKKCPPGIPSPKGISAIFMGIDDRTGQ